MIVDTFVIFFFNDTATTEIYTLSLHDALPIYTHTHTGRQCYAAHLGMSFPHCSGVPTWGEVLEEHLLSPVHVPAPPLDRKSTRLNSSHANISYAVFCLKKKNKPSHRSMRSFLH